MLRTLGIALSALLVSVLAAPAVAATPKIGGTITLTGIKSGEKVRVKLVKVIDPITDGGEYVKPKTGTRWVGVVVKITNVGKVRYSDSPSNGADLIYGTKQAKGTFITDGVCDISTFSSVRLAVGDSRQGCIPYEVPKGKKPTKFQFTMNSGFAEQTGEWRLGK